jgi:hypothetical protein
MCVPLMTLEIGEEGGRGHERERGGGEYRKKRDD